MNRKGKRNKDRNLCELTPNEKKRREIIIKKIIEKLGVEEKEDLRQKNRQ